MAQLRLTRAFINDAAAANTLDMALVKRALGQIERFPGIGSSLLSDYLAPRFGPSCLKFSVAKMDIIYRRIDEEDAVVVLGIIPQKRMR